MTGVTAYPLHWPQGWPRTSHNHRVSGKSRWSSKGKPWTFDAARRDLAIELDRLGAADVVLSTNYELRIDGQPRAGSRVPDDVGIAVYFTYKGRQVAMARDAFDRAEENIRSLTLALRAMRAIEEHGGSHMMERAFNGFAALPPPASNARAWWTVLGVNDQNPSKDDIERAFRNKAKDAHPDAGGSSDRMTELNRARDEALKSLGSR